MTLKEIAYHLSIYAWTLKHGIRVYLWHEEDEGLPCHVFKPLDDAVAKYGDEELDDCGKAVHIDSDSVFFWLK